MNERDIWTTAGLLIKEHGDQATIVAGQKADRFLAMGDRDGQLVWIRVMKAAASMIDPPSGPAH